MAYQNINQYVYNKWYLINRYTGEDISLASDERDFNQEVVFSPYVIGVGDGNTLPININFNSTANTQTFNIEYGEYDFNNIIVAGAYWTPDTFNPNCITAQTLCDIGLTGTDNGLVTGMTGQSITITNGVLTGSSKFDRYSFGREMKFHQVTGYTASPNIRFSGVPSGCVYNIVTKSASTIGTYQEFYGGFYQGFYKLFGFDYDALPTRMNRGWTVEMMIKPRLVDEFFPPSGYTTLNGFYPENENIFFYLGSRAENKYWHHASGETSGYTYVTKDLKDLHTCACSSSAITNSNCEYVYPPTGQTVVHGQCDCYYCNCGPCDIIVNEPEHDPLYDSMSNAIALRLSGDPNNPSVCVRVFRMTGDCEVSGTCITGRTSVTGYTFEEFCSSKGIYDYCSGTTYSDQEHWVQIDAVWERKRWYDDCDLLWKGGLGIITSDPYSAETVGQTLSLIMPPTTNSGSPAPQRVEIVELNNDWLLEKDYRIGTFTIYVNGMPFFIVDNFEEIIPRGLDTIKERQIGVPFNMSIGGGTQGLHDNLIFTGIPTSDYNIYQQDPQLFPDNIMSGTSLSALTNNIYLEKYFAGSFEGGISQFRFYNKPLLSPEIQHNFRVLKNDYDLFNPFCPSCIPIPEDLEVVINECDCPPEYEQLENGNCSPITEVSPTGITCPDGCEYVIGDGEPYCKCLGEEIPCENVPENPIIFCMDYIVMTYEFNTGMDLDIKVGLFDTTQSQYLGWCDSNSGFNYPLLGDWPNSFIQTIMTWGGDNTGRGFETVFINIEKYTELFPSNNELKLDLRCWWFAEAGITPINVRADLYKGGTMRLVNLPNRTYGWVNDSPEATRTFISPNKTIPGPSTSFCLPQGERFATFTYNLESCQAGFDMNDPAPPAIGGIPPTPTPTPTPNLAVYTVFLHVPT